MKFAYEGMEKLQGKIPEGWVHVWQYYDRDVSIYTPPLLSLPAKAFFHARWHIVMAYYWPKRKLERMKKLRARRA